MEIETLNIHMQHSQSSNTSYLLLCDWFVNLTVTSQVVDAIRPAIHAAKLKTLFRSLLFHYSSAITISSSCCRNVMSIGEESNIKPGRLYRKYSADKLLEEAGTRALTLNSLVRCRLSQKSVSTGRELTQRSWRQTETTVHLFIVHLGAGGVFTPVKTH